MIGVRIGGHWWLSILEHSLQSGGRITVKMRHPQNPAFISISNNERWVGWFDQCLSFYLQEFDRSGFVLGEAIKIQIPTESVGFWPQIKSDGSLFLPMFASQNRWNVWSGWSTLPSGFALDNFEDEWYVVRDSRQLSKTCESEAHILCYRDGTTFQPPFTNGNNCRCLVHETSLNQNFNFYAIAGEGVLPLDRMHLPWGDFIDLGDRLVYLTWDNLYETELLPRDEKLMAQACEKLVIMNEMACMDSLPFECQEQIRAIQFWRNYRREST